MKTGDNDKTAFGHRVQLAYDMPCGRPWRKVKAGWIEVDTAKLREFRQARGWTHHTLAKHANNYPEVIARLERGELKRQTEYAVSELARALGVSVEEITLASAKSWR